MKQRPAKTFAVLLRVRKQMENLQARVLAETRREAALAETQRDQLATAQRRALEEAGALVAGAFDARDVRRYYQYERHLAARGVEKDAELRALNTRSEQERVDLEVAMKSRRVVERLIERREVLWLRDQDRADRKVLDEAGSMRAAQDGLEGRPGFGGKRKDP